MAAFSLNHAWWRDLCSPAFADRILRRLGIRERWIARLERLANGLDAKGRARAAGAALDKLDRAETFGGADAYVEALAPLEDWLERLYALENEFAVTLSAGPIVEGLDYRKSRALAAFAERDSVLARSIAEIVRPLARANDLFLFAATSPEDLLTGLIAARSIRAANPAAHISLADHGYENFSLSASLEAAAPALAAFFDTIVATKDERDEVVPLLASSLAEGESPGGVLRRADLTGNARRASRTPVGESARLPSMATFSPEPVLWTRLSARRCYWSRCAFCTQNAKYDEPGAPAKAEVRASLQRLAAMAGGGLRLAIFSDEALSPATLRLAVKEMGRLDLAISWACRCKIEPAHTADLFEGLAGAGCAEVLFGIESASPRVLALMDKVSHGVDAAFAAGALREMSAHGIGAHVNLLAGFPGDSLEEAEASVDWCVEALKDLAGATWILNRFALFSETPAADRPERFGLEAIDRKGDIPGPLDHRLTPILAGEAAKIEAALPRMRERLASALGWGDVARRPGGRLALELYFGSGHGLIFKSQGAANPFANPLSSRAVSPGSRQPQAA